ncbi:MAG: hypothetical protein EBX41_05195 [Chitinophagia bacterium]|nr:hypothetical protein [Chitinophagia bacterium]
MKNLSYLCYHCKTANEIPHTVNQFHCWNCGIINSVDNKLGEKISTTIAAILTIIIFGTCHFLYKYSDDTSKKDNPENQNKIKAFIIAESYVKDVLKSPSTADFGSVFEKSDAVNTVVQRGNTFTVNWHVDAQNSFGAKIRSYYTCRLTYVSGDANTQNSWRCEFLMVDDDIIVGN